MFRVTGEDGIVRLATVQVIQTFLSDNSIKDNLKIAIAQIKAQAQVTGETKAYIRLDASSSPPTKLNLDKLHRIINNELLALRKNSDQDKNLVEFIEVLYNDATGQAQKLFFQVQNGKLVILS